MTLESLKAKLLSDPETKKYYEEMKMEFDIAKETLKLRTQLGLTQRDFADKVGIKQPQLARIESGKQLARLDTLKLIANKCGYDVEIKLVPKQQPLTSRLISPEQFQLENDDDENCWIEYRNE